LLTAGTSHLIKDFWLEVLYPDKNYDKKETLKLSRIFTVILGLVALVIALSVPTIIDALIYSYTMYTAGVFIPVIGGVVWKGATREGALSSLIVGALLAIIGILTGINIAGIPVEIYSAVVALVVFVVVSMLTEKKINSSAQGRMQSLK